MIGVYQIECNGKLYVGSSVNIEKRWKRHLWELKRNKHHSPYLQNAFNKHGELALAFSVLEIVENSDGVIICEQKYIDLLKPEYNICPIAYSCLGRVVSEEHKKKLSQAGMGHPVSEESRRKNSESNKGRVAPNKGKPMTEAQIQQMRDRVVSEETKQKCRIANTGRKHSEETKQKMRGRVPWNKGLPVSEEVKQRLRTANLGKHHTEETKQKMSQSSRGNKSNSGRHLSEETKQKMREAWERRREREIQARI